MITLDWVYIFAGLTFAAFSVLTVLDREHPRRFGTAAFWGLLAVSFLFGSYLGDLGNGVLVLALAALAGFRLLGQSRPHTTTPEERAASAGRRGNWLFVPALMIPAVAILGVLVLEKISILGVPLFGAEQPTIIALGLAVAIALAIAMVWLRPPLLAPLREGRRLMDSVGWAGILPQALAALGAVFVIAGVGDRIGELFASYLPLDTRLLAVVAYCGGMALFTFIMGNAFAAFPVMTAAVGLPLVVMQFGGNPAIVCAIGMLSGFCGTLTTPMAANFNVVPAALLDLPDRDAAFNGVIRAQLPTAAALLVINIVLMYLLAFRF
ncbi:DUF979 domain-containing protein [Brevundimonas sp.]|uniref:DUF979 domain-containing protein n=1 Tax=Brevundimonas sp. TaxID=1871086 RepID=UPI002D44469F|nr:DUF979 domain-containing protein [Brevundimonas sp.]HYC96434.1 DUF979 domain-containing protein [Brevundimonas sp.]